MTDFISLQSSPSGVNARFLAENNADVLAQAVKRGAALVAGPGEWTITHAPAVDTQATATKAAGAAGVRHVLTSLHARLNAVAAQATPVGVTIRDGSGSGTILWQSKVTAVIGTDAEVHLENVRIVGSEATAMTVQFEAAGATGNFETVSATGFSSSEA